MLSKPRYPRLIDAVCAADVQAVRSMLPQGADPNSYDEEYGIFALHRAIGMLSWETVQRDRPTEIIRLLVAHGADVNQPLVKKVALRVAEAGGYAEAAAIVRSAGARLRAEGDRSSLPPAKEREIRKVARDFAFQISTINPGLTNERLAELIEDKIVIHPEPNTTGDEYVRLKSEVRSIIREIVASSSKKENS